MGRYYLNFAHLVAARAEAINLAHLGKTLLPCSTFLPPLHYFFPKACRLANVSRDQVLAVEVTRVLIAHRNTVLSILATTPEFPAHPHPSLGELLLQILASPAHLVHAASVGA